MSIGEAWKDAMGSMNKEQSFKLLDAFVEAGGNAIDTANNYRESARAKAKVLLTAITENEESEQWIGEWMEGRRNRDQMVSQEASEYGDSAEQFLQVIATKYTTSYKAYSLGKNEARNQVGNHKKSLYLSVEDSLKKLKTSYVSRLAISRPLADVLHRRLTSCICTG
jgi:aryl-alcohol dehydrogenase-like predicted oxidoreductase